MPLISHAIVIASGATPQAVAEYRPPPEGHRHIAGLIAQERGSFRGVDIQTGSLMDLEHILRVWKARRENLTSGS